MTRDHCFGCSMLERTLPGQAAAMASCTSDRTGMTKGRGAKFDSLGDRFHQSGLLSDQDGSGWLTVKTLGASGADWALATAKAFAEEWTSRPGIPNLYDQDLVNMHKELSGD